MKIALIRLALAAAVLTAASSPSLASMDTETVLWTTNSVAADPANCHPAPFSTYHRPGRFGLDYECGQWKLHKPDHIFYNPVSLILLLCFGVYLKLRGKKES